jgi:hypothetical protein
MGYDSILEYSTLAFAFASPSAPGPAPRLPVLRQVPRTGLLRCWVDLIPATHPRCDIHADFSRFVGKRSPRASPRANHTLYTHRSDRLSGGSTSVLRA